MAATPDILNLKTEAELRFFVDNPSYYQPELVVAAQRELRRRGLGAPPRAEPASAPATVAATTTYAPAPEPAPPDEDAATAPRPWVLLGSVAAVAFLAGLGFWLKPSAPATATAARVRTPSAAPAAPPKLEEAPASPIPYYDTERYVDKALAQVPPAEKRNEQHLNQYRAVSTRFWAAQNPAAHLIRQAQAGQPNPVLGAQAQLVLGLWHDFDRTQVYSYAFGPVMADHLARMKVIAQYQREALQELAKDTEAQRLPHLDDDQTLAHQQALPHLLAALEHKAGPSTIHL